MYKTTLFLIATIIFFSFQSCDSHSNAQPKEETVSTPAAEDEAVKNQATLNDVVEQFCLATSEKNAKGMSALVYPKLYSAELDKSSVEYMFYRQLQATDKFEITNIEYEGESYPLELNGSDKFYAKKYTSNLLIKINPAAKDGFESLAQLARANDPEAKVDMETLTVSYKDKKKIMLVQNEDGTYIVPDIFLANLSIDGIDMEAIRSAYNSMP